MSRQYRPHHARSSPLWQCLHDSLESFTTGFFPDRSKYLVPLDPSRETALRESLRCGDLASSFLSVQCPDCDHHYLLPFTCKRRGCCPSCHQRRALDTAAFIRKEVCLPVPHPNATPAATAAEKQIPNSRSAKLASKHERGLLEPY